MEKSSKIQEQKTGRLPQNPWKGKKNERPRSKPKGKIDANKLSADDIVIVLVGPTGSGKSTFIKAATGYDGVCHNLYSGTNKVTAVRFTYPELSSSTIVLVEMPASDNNEIREHQVAKMISIWLKETYQKKFQLTGILYFHPITYDQAPSIGELYVLEKLCGGKCQNIIVTTTMWDEVDRMTGDPLECYSDNIFLRRGYSVMKSFQDPVSVFRVLSALINNANQRDSRVLQQEMDKTKKTLQKTSDGMILFQELEELVEQQQEVLSQIREKMNQPSVDEEGMQLLVKSHETISGRLRGIYDRMTTTRVSVGGQLKKILLLSFSWERITSFTVDRWKPKARPLLADVISTSTPDVKPHKVEISANDKIVLVLGLSGSGKTTFIKECIGIKTDVGCSLGGDTAEITPIKTTFEGREVVLVDTPGFDQVHVTDKEILIMIEQWLKDLERMSLKLTGVLYLHDITQPLDEKFLLSHGFCIGDSISPHRYILATTMWESDGAQGMDTQEKESEIKLTGWKNMDPETIRRLQNGHESAIAILSEILEGKK